MTLDELLRTAARDMAEHAPQGEPGTAGIEARARRTRRRRQAGIAGGLVAATALVAVGLRVVGGPTSDPEPVDPPAPTPSIADERGQYADLATVTNAQPGNEGVTELSFEVDVRDRFAYERSHFCSGDPDVWYVMTISNGGGGGTGRCDGDVPDPFPAFPTDVSPFRHSEIASSGTLDVRMFVTEPFRQEYLDCLDKKSTAECRDLQPEPLESADVTFGVSVYEYWAPAAVEVSDERIGALAVADGVDYLLDQVVSADPGEPQLAATVPADSGRHLVSVVSTFTDEAVACGTAANSRKEEEACLPVLGLRIGDRTVLLERGEFGDYPMIGGTHGVFQVPAGAEQDIVVAVASGEPTGIEYSLLVFEESP